mgnify:CR=1 FL=1
MSVSIYFAIGLVWALLFEFIDDQLEEKTLGPGDVGVRVMLVTIWPVTMLIFVIAYISTIIKK